MSPPIPVTAIPWIAYKLNPLTGARTEELISWRFEPPAPGCCPICAVKHGPEYPHDTASLFYITAFTAMVGRPPTWSDAAAHCTPDMRKFCRDTVREDWTSPPKGERPIAHHGIVVQQEGAKREPEAS